MSGVWSIADFMQNGGLAIVLMQLCEYMIANVLHGLLMQGAAASIEALSAQEKERSTSGMFLQP